MFPGQGVTVTVWRSTGRNRDGDRQLAEHHLVEDVIIDWGATRTLGSRGRGDDGRSVTALADAVAYCPPCAGIEAGDVLQLPNGRRLRVEGTPAPIEAPFDWYPGDEVAVTEIRPSR